jgi:hypothetical protein
MRDGSYTSVELTCHDDERVDWRRQAMCEAQLTQAYDRLRLCNDGPAKIVLSLVSIPTDQPVDVMPTLDEAYAALDLYEWLEGLEAGGQSIAAVRSELLARDRPDLWANEKAAKAWKKLAFPKPSSKSGMSTAPIKIDIIFNRLKFHRRLSPTLCNDSAFREGWHLAKYRIGGRGGGEWSLFVYNGDRPNRAQLAAHLEVPPESLVMMTLAGQPLVAEGETLSTGDALLDRGLAHCAANRMALPLDPEPLAALPGTPWRDAKAVKNWKAGVTVSEILKLGPPEGWHRAEYRVASRRGGKAAVAWIPDGTEPLQAIAAALGRSLKDVVVLSGPKTDVRHP